MEEQPKSLAKRSIRSVTWNAASSLIVLPLNIIQMIILARLLPVEYFGIFAGTSAGINVTSVIFEFGLGSAFVHRSPETADEERAAACFFSLRLIFDTLWLIILLFVGGFFLSGLSRLVLVVLAIVGYLQKLNLIPRALLIRRVEHKRSALVDLLIGSISAIVSVVIAVLTRSMWALLASSILSFVIAAAGFYLYKPVWKPRLGWDYRTIRYFLSFGGRNVVNSLLESLLDNLDNLWTGSYLGNTMLGYYSRAFKFATYPRMVIANPVNLVAIGTYAELKEDRLRRSQAFFRTNALMLRAGFLLGGWLWITSPELIRLLIGARWMPMLDAFRLMLIFALLEPVKLTVSSVLITMGVPEKITRIRLVQLVVLVGTLFAFGLRWKISGVALAMDLMAIVGMILALHFARQYVDLSYWRLFLAPTIALGLALGFTDISSSNLISTTEDWILASFKTLSFVLIYLFILVVWERHELLALLGQYTDLSVYSNNIRNWFGDKF